MAYYGPLSSTSLIAKIYKQHYSGDALEARIRYYANLYKHEYTGYNGVFHIDELKPTEPEFNEWGEICP